MADNGGKPGPLCAAYVQQNLGRRNGKPILDACLERGVLTTDGKFEQGKSCRGYLLGEQFKGAKFGYRVLTDRDLLARLAKTRELVAAKKKKTWSPWHYRWEDWQKRLGIDKPLALDILYSMPAGKDNYSMQTRLIDDIYERRYRMSLDNQGRLYGNPTNIKREVRAALLLGGEKIGGVDMANSQPALLGLLMKQRSVRGVGDYVDMACSGVLYDHLARQLGVVRDVAKKLLFQDVLGKKGNYPSEMTNLFESQFPRVWQFIRDFNRDDHGALLLELQRVESNLVIRQVAMSLPKDRPYFSIHDGVYCIAGDEQTVRDAFEKSLNGYPIGLSSVG
jgi:hypothetical protein